MKEILISSSVLILALTALRFLFRKRISRRLQYALWGLVLLRLALPVPLPEARFSVMTGAERLTGQIETVRPVSSISPAPPVSPAPGPVSTAPHPSPSSDGLATVTPTGTGTNLLLFVWLAGMGLTLGCFLLSNLRFSLRLRRGRTTFNAPGCPLPVYVSETVVSPCLFGLFRPAVYLTPRAALEPETQIHHVLTHELCHYRHGDHVWSILRCLVLSVYWFDPFVWLAAALSRVDGEQACDEAAIRALGEEQRLSYGKTLVDMIAVRNAPSGLFCTATTMVSGSKSLKNRLERIVRRQKPFVWAIAVTLLAAAALAGCTFTAAKKASNPSSTPDSSNEAGSKSISHPIRMMAGLLDENLTWDNKIKPQALDKDPNVIHVNSTAITLGADTSPENESKPEDSAENPNVIHVNGTAITFGTDDPLENEIKPEDSADDPTVIHVNGATITVGTGDPEYDIPETPVYGQKVGPFEEIDPGTVSGLGGIDGLQYQYAKDNRVQYQFNSFPGYTLSIFPYHGKYLVYTVTNNGQLRQHTTVGRRSEAGRWEAFSNVLVEPGQTCVRVFRIDEDASFSDCSMHFGIGGELDRYIGSDVTISLEQYDLD